MDPNTSFNIILITLAVVIVLLAFLLFAAF